MTDFTARHNREINSHFIQRENAFYTRQSLCVSRSGGQSNSGGKRPAGGQAVLRGGRKVTGGLVTLVR